MFDKRSCVLAAVLAALSMSAFPQTGTDPGFPSKPVRFFAAFPAGGVTDIVARIIAPELSQRLGQPVVVDNRAGAGGVIGVDAVAKSAPDGYTIGIGTSGSLVANVTLMAKLPYSPLKDLIPVSRAVDIPIALVVHPSLGVSTLSEFIASAKSRSKQIHYGTAGNGTTMHLAGELLNRMAGLQLVHAPYKGTAPAATDLLAGHIESAFLDLATVRAHLESGRLKALAVTSAKRSVVAPGLPTVAEAAVPGYQLHSWLAIVLRAGTPPDIVERLNRDLTGVLRDPKVQQALLAAKVEPAPSTTEQMRETIAAEIKVTGEMIRAFGISIE